MSANNQAAALNESFFLKAAIGGVSCSTATFILNPLDVARIRMQNQSRLGASVVQYTSMRHTLQRIFAEEGARGLMRGIEPSMCREVFYSSLRIGWYEPIRKLLVPAGSDPTQTSPLVKYIASLLSGALGSAIANPFDLIKTRMQAILPGEAPPYRNTFHAMKSIATEQGIIDGLYKGWAVTSARAAVLTSAQIGTYDVVKRNLMMDIFHLEDGFQLHFGSSMIAGLVTTTATNPFDVIKTRYLSDREGRYKSIMDCVMKTFKNDGVKGFFKGWTPAYWRIGPHTVMSLMFIEKLRSFAGLRTM